jgi:hypothetical protein
LGDAALRLTSPFIKGEIQSKLPTLLRIQPEGTGTASQAWSTHRSHESPVPALQMCVGMSIALPALPPYLHGRVLISVSRGER